MSKLNISQLHALVRADKNKSQLLRAPTKLVVSSISASRATWNEGREAGPSSSFLIQPARLVHVGYRILIPLPRALCLPLMAL